MSLYAIILASTALVFGTASLWALGSLIREAMSS